MNDAPKKPAKKSLLPWFLLLILGCAIGLACFWLYWHARGLPKSQFVGAALLLWLVTALSGAPLIRFVIFGWDARHHEFLNRLNNDSLIAYLQQFWEKRVTEDASFIGWTSKQEETQKYINTQMQKIFDSIYHEQYGRNAFIPPLVLLFFSVFMSMLLSILIYLHQIDLVLNIDASVSLSSIAGAYMYVVSDGIQNARQRSLNASAVYWYVLRMVLAIPIGVALTYPLPHDVKPFIAFGMGALPMDDIIKLLRRLASKQLNLAEPEEKTDQLIHLQGVTTRIFSLLSAEGVDSIEQIITVDPVLLSIRTGLPFKFILHLGAQAIVRRHLGVDVEKLMPLGLTEVNAIVALVTQLDNEKDSQAQARAKALLAAAAKLVLSDQEQATDCLEFNFRQIAANHYTQFILGKPLAL